MQLIPASFDVILEEESSPVGLKGKAAESFAKQGALAKGNLGDDYLAALEEARGAAEGGALAAYRDSVSSLELTRRQQENNANIMELLRQPGTNSDIVAGNILRHMELSSKSSALEELAQDSVSQITDPVKRAIFETQRSSYDKVQEENRRLLIWKNFSDKLNAKEEQESVVEEIPDFLKLVSGAEMIERRLGIGVSDYVGQIRHIMAEIENTPIDQLPATLDQFEKELYDMQVLFKNPAVLQEVISLGAFGDEVSDANSGFFDMLAVADTPLLFAGAKLGTSLLKAGTGRLSLLRSAKAAGDEGKVVDDILGDIDEAKIIEDVEDQVQAMQSLRSFDDPFPTFSSAVEKTLNRNFEILDDAFKNSNAPEYTQEIAERHLRELNLDTSADSIIRVEPFPSEAAYRAEIGDFHGRPFVTEELAQDTAHRLNLPDAVIHELPEGGYTIRKKWNVDKIAPTEGGEVSRLGLYLQNVDNFISPQIIKESRAAEGKTSAVFEAAKQVFDNSLMPILKNKKKKVAFQRVIQDGVKEKRWLTPQEFASNWKASTGKDATEVDLAAYKAYKQLNDFDFMLKNEAKYKRKAAQGLKTYDIELPDGRKLDLDAKPASMEDILQGEGLQRTNTKHVFVYQHITKDGARASYTASPADLKSGTLDELMDSHHLVRLDKESTDEFLKWGSMREPAQYTLLPKNILSRELKQNQVQYAGGGRRIVNAPFLVKSARTGKYKDGSSYRLSDKSLFVASTRKQAQEMSNKLTEAFRLAKEGATDLDIQKLGLGHIGLQTIDDVIEFGLSKRLINDIETDDVIIQGVGDREPVRLSPGSPFSTDVNDDAYYANMGSSMNSMRAAEVLPHVDGMAADVLDPLSSLAQNIDRSANMAGFDAFRERALESLKTKYGSFIDHDFSGNPMDILTANVKRDTPADIALKVQAEQMYIKEIFRHQTPDQKYWQHKVEQALDFAFDSKAGQSLELTVNKLGNWYKEARFGDDARTNVRRSLTETLGGDPSSRIKSIVFNAKLGLFNPASFIIQASQGLTIASIVGKDGWKAAAKAPIARMAMHMDDEAIQEMAKNATKLGWKDSNDFIEYVREFKHLGLNYLDKNIAYIDGVSGAQFGTNSLSRVADFSRSFFNEGERSARLTAYGAARAKWLGNARGVDGKPVNPSKAKATSKEGREYIQNETHRLMFGMTRADVQFGFRGAKGIPTQFLSYPFRAISALLPKQLGGRAFTKEEKLRMIAAYGILYGSAGIPIADQVAEYMATKHGDKVSPETMKLFTNGIIDGSIFVASGGEMDTNFAGRAGIGQFMTDMSKMVTDKSALEFASGAAGQTGLGAYDALTDAMRVNSVWTNPTLDGIKDAGIAVMVDQVSSLSNAYKAYLGWETQKLYDQYGRRFGAISKSEIVAMMAGLPPQTYEDAGRLFKDSKKRNDIVKDASQDILFLQRQYLKAVENRDDKKAEDALRDLNLRGYFLQQNGLTFDVMNSVRNANKSTDTIERLLMDAQMRHFSTPEEGNANVPKDILERRRNN